MSNLSIHREADDDEQVPEGGDHDADGHRDGDQDRQHHPERSGPTRWTTVLDGDTVSMTCAGVGAQGPSRVQGRVQQAWNTFWSLERVGDGGGEGGHRARDQRGGRRRGRLEEASADLRVETVHVGAHLPTFLLFIFID